MQWRRPQDGSQLVQRGVETQRLDRLLMECFVQQKEKPPVRGGLLKTYGRLALALIANAEHPLLDLHVSKSDPVKLSERPHVSPTTRKRREPVDRDGARRP